MSGYSTVRIHNKVKDFVFKWHYPLEGATREQTLMKMALVLNEIGVKKVSEIYNKKVKDRFPELFKSLDITDKRFKENEKE